MRKLYIITGMLLALAISAHGQVSNPSIVPTASNPTGNACTAGVPMLYYAGTYYGCDGTGHYAAVGGGGGAWSVNPSGDTTGATDGTAIAAACATYKIAQLAAGKYYVGHSNSTITLSSPCLINGSGMGPTIIQNEGSTNYIFTFSYGGFIGTPPTLFVSGGVTNLTIQQDASVTPTAGGAIIIGTGCSGFGCGTNVTGNAIFRNLILQGLFRGFYFKDGQAANTVDDIHQASNTGTGGCIEYNSGIPNGGNQINNVNCFGTNSDYIIDQSDTTHNTNITMSEGQLRFTQAGTVLKVTFVNFVSEDSIASCAVDFGTGGVQPVQVEFTGGHIGNATVAQAFCNGGTIGSPNGFSVANMTFSTGTIDGTTVPTSTQSYTWGTFIPNLATPSLATASTPAFSPVPGIYTSTQNVSISCTYGAPYYLSSGASTAYSAPIAIASTSTINAICTGLGYTPTLGSASYTISASALVDNFSGTAATLLSAHTSDSGNTWAQSFTGAFSQTLELDGSGAITPTGTGSIGAYLSNWTPPSADYTVQATCNISGTDFCGVIGRAVAGSQPNDYLIFFSSAGVQLYKHVAGSPTQLGATYSGVTSGSHTLALVMTGTAISVKVDGTTQITATDSSFAAAGQAGVVEWITPTLSSLVAN